MLPMKTLLISRYVNQWEVGQHMEFLNLIGQFWHMGQHKTEYFFSVERCI